MRFLFEASGLVMIAAGGPLDPGGGPLARTFGGIGPEGLLRPAVGGPLVGLGLPTTDGGGRGPDLSPSRSLCATEGAGDAVESLPAVPGLGPRLKFGMALDLPDTSWLA